MNSKYHTSCFLPPKGMLVSLLLFFFFWQLNPTAAQTDTIPGTMDSIQSLLLREFNTRLAEIEQKRFADSIKKEELEQQIVSLKATDNLQKETLRQQLEEIKARDVQHELEKKARIDALRSTAKGYPVIGAEGDTLFFIYTKIGSLTPMERAGIITRKILQLYEDDFLTPDSLTLVPAVNTVDIMCGQLIVMSVSETDALWYDTEMEVLAGQFKNRISESVLLARKNNSLSRILIRIGLVFLVFLIAWLLLKLIGKGYRFSLRYIVRNKNRWLKNLAYRDYTFLTADQELQGILIFLKGLRWFTYVLLVYISLPIIFSIFPFTRGWADNLLNLIWSPFRGVFVSVWNYLPNLFTILVILTVMKYFIRFVRYIFTEIEAGKLKISGFHDDWAMPTYSIVRVLLYAFMFVMIFPYLPGSDSDIFKGVSVFIGILFSLGSSSAIANMVAGLVITYMRPFKINDRIKIGEITGDVIEKTMLVTRLKTIKNEIITIPNSSILTGNTTNYSNYAGDAGLIIHTMVTMGYEVPWRDVHQLLTEAALKTKHIEQQPAPFVLQTSLEDFYAAYQLNAYTREPGRQASIYSELHQNIQDLCAERGIELMSPHYRATRDGNHSTIPPEFLPKDYAAPGFTVHFDAPKPYTATNGNPGKTKVDTEA